MKKYRKKPVVVEAVRWTGKNFDEIYEWGIVDGDSQIMQDGAGWRDDEPPGKLLIETLEGGMKADIGDWIIRGIRGEFYPCKPAIFKATYDPA